MKELLKKINFSFQTVALAIVLSLTFFLLGVERFKSYQSEVNVLIISKSQTAVSQRSQIVDNAIQVPKMLSFYDRVLKENPSIKDPSSGQKPDQRKKMWNEMVSVKQLASDSSAFSISILSDNEQKAGFIASKTARTLFDVLSAYYNAKDDVDLRIVDGPITKVIVIGWQWIFLLSVLFGVLIAIIFGQLTALRRKAFNFQEMLFKNNPLRNLKTAKEEKPMSVEILKGLYENEEAQEFSILSELQQMDKAKTQEIEDQEKLQEKLAAKEIENLQEIASRSVYPNFPEMPLRGAPKSSAPDNLPIGDFGSDFELPVQNEPVSEIETASEEIVKEKVHEPTPEELKKRLNQLLRGEM